MRKFNAESAAIAMELQQLLVDFCRESDFNDARNITDYYTADGTLVVGETRTLRGHAEIQQFYADRNRRVASEQRDGVRTVRHTVTNVQIVIEDANHATLNYGNLNYSGAGVLPVTGLVGPVLFSDCEMKLRREEDGQWRVAYFYATPVFLGDDAFLNKTILKPKS